MAPRHVLTMLSGPGGQVELRASKMLSTTDIAPLRHGRFAAAFPNDAFNQIPTPASYYTPSQLADTIFSQATLYFDTNPLFLRPHIRRILCAQSLSLSLWQHPSGSSSNLHLSSHAILPQNLDSPLHPLHDV